MERPVGGGEISRQHLELKYNDATPPFYRIIPDRKNNKIIETLQQNPKSLMPEYVCNNILDLMQNQPKRSLSYYVYTSKRGQTYQLFKYDGMFYVQQVKNDQSMITFYPMNEEDLRSIYDEVIIDRIPVWK